MLDQLENKKTADMVSEFAFPLASLIIAGMLGVPEEERYQFRQWTADLIQTIDLTRTRKVMAKGGDTVAKLTAYFKNLIEKRKAHPSEDLISTFAGHEQLADEEVLATCILLVIAGHETTVNLLTNGLFLLMTHPDQLSELKENPLLIESAVKNVFAMKARQADSAHRVGGLRNQRENHQKRRALIYPFRRRQPRSKDISKPASI